MRITTVLVGLLGLALVLFALACVPARVVPWRPVAIFIHDRQTDVTVFGLALLMTAGIAILLTH